MNARDKLAAAILRVAGMDPHEADPAKRGLAPYFGALIRGLVRRETPGLGTVGVTADGLLLWDPAFIEKKDSTELAKIMLHEVIHVALKHPHRIAALGIVPEPTSDMGAKAYIANIAADMADNQELEKMNALPEGAWLPEACKLPRGLTLEEYYRLLLKNPPKQSQQGDGQGQGGAGRNQQGQGGGQNDTSKVGKGWCGSCAGHPLPGEPAAKGGSQPDPEARSEAEMERFRKQSAEAAREYEQKFRGTVPAGIQRWADEMLSPPKIPWREKLGRLVRGAVAYKSGAVDLTWLKPSRRQAGVGFGPGRPIVPALHAPLPNVGVVVDTSGSMGSGDLAAAASETNGILKALGAKVTVVACDATVHGIKECKSITEAVTLFKGGGGTSMAPAMQALLDKKPMPTVVVIMTDGFIGNGYLAEAPPYKVIWCVIGKNGNKTPCPYGDVVVVDDSDQERDAA